MLSSFPLARFVVHVKTEGMPELTVAGHAVDEDVPSQRTVNDKARAILTRPNVRHGGGRASHKETVEKKG